MHRLTDIDEERQRATCAVCGPDTPVKPSKRTSRVKPIWRCRRAFNKGRERGTPWRALLTDGSRCERCGFEPEHLCQLDVHRHRDPDPEILCANCHRLETLRERGLYPAPA